MNDPNSFVINPSVVLFFNIFIKNNRLYCITPLYKKNIINHNEMIIQYEDCQLTPTETIRKEQYEATQIIIYNLPPTIQKTYDICVKYMNGQKKYTLPNTICKTSKKLTLTTLFKTDYKLNEPFYKYYKTQGVEHFYMYYNGIINDDIKSYYNKPDITLIEWNFKYWNTNSDYSKHHAQLGQLHDALYRFGKDTTEYMIFCDLDEYLYNKQYKLNDLIKQNSFDSFVFINKFANVLTKDIPKEFPSEFKIGPPLPFPQRTKNIHKVDSIIHLGIHRASKYNKDKTNVDKSSVNFHFHTWGGEYIENHPTPETIKIKIP